MSEEITSAEDVLRAQLSEVYTQLEQAENNLKLSAEIGKALLEQNGKLESDYSVAMAENTNRVEQLEQENHDLRREKETLEHHCESLERDSERDEKAWTDRLERQKQRYEERSRDDVRERNRAAAETETVRAELAQEREVKALLEGKVSRLELHAAEQRRLLRRVEGFIEEADEDDDLARKNEAAARQQERTRMQERLETLEERVVQLEDELAVAQGARETAETSLASAQQMARDATEQVAEMKESLMSSRARIEELKNEVEELQLMGGGGLGGSGGGLGGGGGGGGLFAELDDQRAAMERELLGLQVRFGAAQRALNQSRGRERQLRARVAMSLQCNGTNGGAADVARVGRLEAAVSQARGDAQKLMSQLRQSERKVADLESRLHSAHHQGGGEGDKNGEGAYLDYLQSESEALRIELQQTREELRTRCLVQASEADKMRGIERRLYGTEAQLERVIGESTQARVRIDELEETVGEGERVNGELHERVKELEEELRGVSVNGKKKRGMKNEGVLRKEMSETQERKKKMKEEDEEKKRKETVEEKENVVMEEEKEVRMAQKEEGVSVSVEPVGKRRAKVIRVSAAENDEQQCAQQ